MDVAYPQLSNWTCLQQTLIAQLAQTVNDAFSAMMRGSDVLFPNDFGRTCFSFDAFAVEGQDSNRCSYGVY